MDGMGILLIETKNQRSLHSGSKSIDNRIGNKSLYQKTAEKQPNNPLS